MAATKTAEAPAVPKRPYTEVVADLKKAKEELHRLSQIHSVEAERVRRHAEMINRKIQQRMKAVQAGTIMPDDDVDESFFIPKPKYVDPVLHEQFYKQHYVVAQCQEEEASYGASEKSTAFRAESMADGS